MYYTLLSEYIKKGANFAFLFLIYCCYYIYYWYNGVYWPR